MSKRPRLPIRELAMTRDPKKYGDGWDRTFGRRETCGDCKMHGKCMRQPYLIKTKYDEDLKCWVEELGSVPVPDPDAKTCDAFEEVTRNVYHIGY